MKRCLQLAVATVAAISFLPDPAVGVEAGLDSLQEKTSFSGVSGVTFGQIMSGYRPGSITESQGGIRQKFHKDILLGWDVWLTLELQLSQKVRGVFSGGGNISYDLYANYQGLDRLIERRKQSKRSFFGITQTYLDFNLIKSGNTEFDLKVGYFPNRYSPHAKNLGEYLFRTEAYPNVIFTGGIDNCTPSVLGIKFSSKYHKFLSNDFILSSESETYPFFDVSLSDIVTLSVADLLSIGVGGSLWRVVPADDDLTTPGKLETTNYGYREQYRPLFDDTATIDPDTITYTRKATKLVSTVSFDPKGLFPSEAFGEKDLILYAEAAVLGVKDYPQFYDDIVERTPIMVGFNVPTFKLLDVLAIELEHHSWEYPNTIEGIYTHDSPIPLLFTRDMQNLQGVEETIEVGKVEDNFKWSIYFKRTIFDHFIVQGQAAKDHFRMADSEGRLVSEPNFGAFGEWYYMLKAQYAF